LVAEFAAEPAPETIALASRLRESATRAVAPKRPGSRWRFDAAEVDVARTAASDVRPDGLRSTGSRRLLRASLVGGVVVGVSLFAVRVSARRASPPGIAAAAPLTSVEDLEVQTAIAPNGRLAAYARGTTRQLRIVVQRIGGAEPWLLTSDSGAIEQMPRW